MTTNTLERDCLGNRAADRPMPMSIGAGPWPRYLCGCAAPKPARPPPLLAAASRAENHLLRALAPIESARWQAQLENVEMPLGQVLHEAGSTLTHVYFPTSAVVSLMYVTEDGASAETAAVGNEGLVGVSQLLGGGSMPSRAVVQCAGRGLRLRAQTLREEFEHSGALQRLLLRYIQALIAQMSQTSVCNRHHSLDQQLSRWLLCSLDRVHGSELVITQELIAHALGVRRESITAAALRLQKAGMIRYARGHIAVLDRAGLERVTCECYAVVRNEYHRLLPEKLAA